MTLNRPQAYDTTKINVNSVTWAALMDGWTEKLKTLRNQNDSLIVGPEKTIEIRAKIAVYKELLELMK